MKDFYIYFFKKTKQKKNNSLAKNGTAYESIQSSVRGDTKFLQADGNKDTVMMTNP